MRTLLVGLDAACLPVLEPLFETDAVPNLEAIFDEGVSGPLRSQVPPWTASAWPSLYTGKNPGKHGVFDFLSFDGYDWDVVNNSDIKARTIWDYLDENGLTSVIVNAPVTDPPREISGAIIPGYLAPNEPKCQPEGILEDIRESVGEYRVYAERETDDRVDEEAKFEEYVRLTHLRGETFRYLTDRFDPDFGFVQFQKTDAVFHDFPGEMDKVRAVYEAVDEEIGAILEQFDPEVVVVASDHGMGEYDGYEVRVNEILKQEDLVETTTDGRGVPSWFQLKDEELVGGENDSSSDSKSLERLAALAAKGGLTYQRGKAILDKLGLAEFVGKHVPIGAVFAASESVSFETSKAYLRSGSELGVRLNVEGREPNGVVPEGEYESVRDEVIEILTALTDPEGRPVFDEVVPRTAYIDGPFAEEAVDVLCIPREFENSLSVHVGDVFSTPEPWNHKLDGVIAVAGKGVDSDANISEAHLFDVAPTVLSTFSVAPDTAMDGETLSAVNPVDPKSYPEFEISERSKTEDEEVAQRLEDLGYLE
ncbi:phosphodiesterase [Halogeometricum borinquense]|uniref:Phosphodiesterase n=1 Tax=Halogeometricum borinquense TaxID=60847 RepID=A0A482T7C7_9EURY|nr:alkaline phosphatase family protein [Halogeometricum borinquense]RYJ13704.1 phosphodiesterase [Halogeometricum borinquense]